MGKSTISTGPFSVAFCMFTRPGMGETNIENEHPSIPRFHCEVLWIPVDPEEPWAARGLNFRSDRDGVDGGTGGERLDCHGCHGELHLLDGLLGVSGMIKMIVSQWIIPENSLLT